MGRGGSVGLPHVVEGHRDVVEEEHCNGDIGAYASEPRYGALVEALESVLLPSGLNTVPSGAVLVRLQALHLGLDHINGRVTKHTDGTSYRTCDREGRYR